MRERVLWAVLAVSLAARLTVLGLGAADPGRFLTHDSRSYHDAARSIAELGTFAVSPERPDEPQTLRTPGYPTLLAAGYRVFGPRPEIALVAQVLASVLTIALLYLVGGERWDRRLALIAGLLLALDLASFVQSLLVLTESVFTLLIVASLFCALRVSTAERPGRWVFLLGLCLACATQVRPITYYFPVLAAIWVVAAARGRGAGGRRRWQLRTVAMSLALFALPCLVLVGGWQLRNARVAGAPVFCSIEGYNMLFFRAASVVQLRDGITRDEALERLGKGRYQELHPETEGWTMAELSRRWTREGLGVLSRHPLLYARVTASSLIGIFLGTGEHRLMTMVGLDAPATGPLGDLLRLDAGAYARRWVLGRPLHFLGWLLATGFLLAVYLGAAAWWWQALRERRVELFDVYAWTLFVYLLLVAAGPEAGARFRVPWMPIACLYAAAGFGALRDRRRGSGR